MRENLDHLIVAHISDKKKDYLPWNMKSNYIRDAYEAKIIGLGDKAHYSTVEVSDGKSSKEELWELAEFEKATFIVVGNHGRKGPKGDETVLGTQIQYLSLNSKFPIMIIKDRKPREQKPDGCLRYGICYDGSTKSRKALSVCLGIMRPEDKMTIITVKEPLVKSDGLEGYVREEASRFGVSKLEFVLLDLP